MLLNGDFYLSARLGEPSQVMSCKPTLKFLLLMNSFLQKFREVLWIDLHIANSLLCRFGF